MYRTVQTICKTLFCAKKLIGAVDVTMTVFQDICVILFVGETLLKWIAQNCTCHYG